MASIEHLTDEDIDILDYLLPLAARWKAILLVTLIGSAVAFGIARLIPKTYESTATVFVLQSSKMPSILKDLPISLMSGSNNNSTYLMTLLQSETLMQNVINRLDLARNPDFTGRKRLDREEMMSRLKKMVSVKDNKSGGITVAIRSRNPYLASKIGNSMLDALGKMVVTSSKRKSDFISDRLDETSAALKKAEDEMVAFQQENDVTLIDEDTKAMIKELTDLDARLLALDAELQGVGSQLQNAGELNSLVDQEVRRKSIESSRDYVLRKRDELRAKVAGLPSVAADFLRLQRKIGVLEKTFEMLTEQYQMARITQQGEDGDYQIVDTPLPKLKPVGPRVGIITVIGGLLGMLLAATAVNVSAKTKRRTISHRAAPEKPKVGADTN